jgi:hypothetical protein
MNPRSAPLSFRLPTEVKAALEKAARDDNRSVSSLLEEIVVHWLRQQTYLPAQHLSEMEVIARTKLDLNG